MTAQEREALRYAKKGIFLALLSGLIFSADGLLVKSSSAHYPFNRPGLMRCIPLFCAGVHDMCAALVTTFVNWRTGRLRELQRSLFSKPGRSIILGAFIGALCGMGGYMMALQCVDAAYVLPITSLYPGIAAILAMFVLKERISPRAWLGLALCVAGAAAIGYGSPEGQAGNLFYLGLGFAALAAIGWSIEGVCAASGMDFIEPLVALNIYYYVSAFLYVGILVPLAVWVDLPEAETWALLGGFASSKGTLLIACAGFFGTCSYACWFSAINMTGVTRAMALNISYALWGIVLSFLFTDADITPGLTVGAGIIFAGMVLVIGNPKDMTNLRKS
jgi:drug/metabolite transporter (DMT)-like permease